MYVCLCKGLTERDIDRCVQAGATTEEALVAALGLDDDDTCGRCARDAADLLPSEPTWSLIAGARRSEAARDGGWDNGRDGGRDSAWNTFRLGIIELRPVPASVTGATSAASATSAPGSCTARCMSGEGTGSISCTACPAQHPAIRHAPALMSLTSG